MRLESGAPRSSKTYWAAIVVVMLGVTAWFAYDWRSGYAKKNLKMAHKILMDQGLLGESDSPPLTAEFTRRDFRDLEAEAPTSPSRVRSQFGQPFKVRSDMSGNAAEHYVSRYGMITVEITNGRITRLLWTTWYKGKDAIDAQLYWACVPALAALFAVFKIFKTLSLRVTLDDAGMIYGGLRISYADMTAFTGYSAKGWVDLNHRAGGDEKKLRLDNQRVDKYEEIIRAICEKAKLKCPFPDDGQTQSADDEDNAE